MGEKRAGTDLEERKPVRKKVLKRILLIVAGILVLYVLANTIAPVAVVSGMVNRRYEHKKEDAKEKGAGTFVRTSDGEEIWMKLCPAEAPRGVIIFISGLGGPAATKFQAHADWVNELGYTAVLMELRAHGISSGERIGLGFLETEDVRAVYEALREDPETARLPVYLFGVSMGGATALNAFGEIPEIAGVIALSPYVSFEEVFDIRMKDAFVPPLTRKYVGLLLGAFLDRTYGKELVDTRNPREEIQKASGRPVFLIASKEDPRVPSENALRLQEICPEAEFWMRDGGNHLVVKGNDLMNVPKDAEYRAKIEEWLEKYAR